MTIVAASSELAARRPVLVAATAGAGLSAVSLLTSSFGTFIVPLSREFGWSRGQINLALLFMTGVYALTSPLLGTMLDRYGSRRMALISIPPLTITLAGLSLTGASLVYFYACFVLSTLAGSGTAPVSYSRAINQSFVRQRGMALGIMFSGMGFAAALFPMMTTAVTETFGWRASYVLVALMALAAFPAVYWGLPRTDHGAANRSGRTLAARVSYDFLRRRTFWTITAACSIAAFASYGLLVNLVPLLMDTGLSPASAARYAALVGFSSAAARLVVGFLLDRIFAPHIGAVVLACSALGCLAFLNSGVSVAAVTSILIGFSFGMEVDLVSFLVARYFGMRRYGLIYGVLYSCFSASAALGPAVGGFVFDATGSYRQALVGAAVLMLVSAATMLLLPRYPREDDEREDVPAAGTGPTHARP